MPSNTFSGKGAQKKNRSSLRVSLVASLVTSLVICSVAGAEEATFTLTEGVGGYCSDFVRSLKSSQIIDMTNDKLCDVISGPVNGYLKGKAIKDLDWSPYHIDNLLVEAERHFEVSLGGHGPNAERDGAKWHGDMSSLIQQGRVHAFTAPVHSFTGDATVIELRMAGCDSHFKLNAPLPIQAFRSGESYMLLSNYLPGGMFEYRGNLSAFHVGSGWFDPDGKKTHTELFVSIYGFIEYHGTVYGFAPGRTCSVEIIKPNRGRLK